MKFNIQGAHKDTGENVNRNVEAPNAAVVEKWAAKHGILWTSIESLEPHVPAPIPQMPQESPPVQLPAALYVPLTARRGKLYKVEQDSFVWIAGLIVVLLLAYISQPQFPADAETFGEMTGGAFGVFIVVFLLGFIGAKVTGKTSSRSRSGFSIGAGIAFLICIGGAIGMRHSIDARTSARSHADSSQIPNISDMNATDAADAKLLVNEIRAFAAEGKAMGDKYQEDGQKILGDGIVAPANLDSLAKITSARSRIDRFRNLLAAHEEDEANYFGGLPNRINALPIGEVMKKSAIEGFQEKLPATKKIVEQMNDADRKFLDEATNLFDFLQPRLGKFAVKDGQAIFETDADVTTFNEISGRIKHIADVEEQLSNDAVTTSQQAETTLDQIVSPRGK